MFKKNCLSLKSKQMFKKEHHFYVYLSHTSFTSICNLFYTRSLFLKFNYLCLHFYAIKRYKKYTTILLILNNCSILKVKNNFNSHFLPFLMIFSNSIIDRSFTVNGKSKPKLTVFLFFQIF